MAAIVQALSVAVAAVEFVGAVIIGAVVVLQGIDHIKTALKKLGGK